MFDANTEIGSVFVQTTDHRGHTVEEIAERAANRLLSVDSREALHYWLVKYLREAQNSVLEDAQRKLIEQGFNDAAARLGD